MLVLASTFLLNLSFGWFDLVELDIYLRQMASDPDGRWLLFGLVVALLAIDSWLAVPTLSIMLLAGYLLGPALGGLAAALGVLSAGSLCYVGGRLSGKRLYNWIVPRENQSEVAEFSETKMPLALMLSRGFPILPEALSIICGMTRYPLRSYYLYFFLGHVPFAFVAAYFGSISTLDKPWPALIFGICAPAAFFLAWRLFTSKRRSQHAA